MTLVNTSELGEILNGKNRPLIEDIAEMPPVYPFGKVFTVYIEGLRISTYALHAGAAVRQAHTHLGEAEVSYQLTLGNIVEPVAIPSGQNLIDHPELGKTALLGEPAGKIVTALDAELRPTPLGPLLTEKWATVLDPETQKEVTQIVGLVPNPDPTPRIAAISVRHLVQ